MGTAVFTGFEAVGTVSGSTVRFTGFEAITTPSTATVVFNEFQVYSNPLGATAVFTGFEAKAVINTLSAILTGPVTAEPGDTITLSMAASQGTPTSYLIEQIHDSSGRVPDLVISNGNTANATVNMPLLYPDAVNYPNDQPYVLQFRGTVNDGVGVPSIALWNVTVFPHLFWTNDAVPPFTRRPFVFFYNAPPPVVPPANPMPTANIPAAGAEPAWQFAYGEDFSKGDVPLGGFDTVTTGSDLGLLSTASPGGILYNQSFKVKQKDSFDTSHNAKYNATKTTRVINGVFEIYDHIEAGQAYGGAIKPLLPPGLGVDKDFFTIGVYIRWRARYYDIIGTGFGGVWLAINDNAFPTNGEFDVQEGHLGDTVKGNRHPAQASNVTLPVAGPPGLATTDFHNWGMKWFMSNGTTPRTIWDCDGIVYLDTTDRIASGAQTLGFLFQSGSDGAPVPAGNQGRIQVDWITIHKGV